MKTWKFGHRLFCTQKYQDKRNSEFVLLLELWDRLTSQPGRVLAGIVEIISSSYNSIYALYFKTSCLKRSAKSRYYNNKQQFRNDRQSGKPT